MVENSYKLYDRLLRLGGDWSVFNNTVDDIKDELHVYVDYNKKEWIDYSSGEIFKIHDRCQERVIRPEEQVGITHLKIIFNDYPHNVQCELNRGFAPKT